MISCSGSSVGFPPHRLQGTFSTSRQLSYSDPNLITLCLSLAADDIHQQGQGLQVDIRWPSLPAGPRWSPPPSLSSGQWADFFLSNCLTTTHTHRLTQFWTDPALLAGHLMPTRPQAYQVAPALPFGLFLGPATLSSPRTDQAETY